jgi:hypothetical protein
MPDNTAHVDKTLTDLRNQLAAKVEEAKRLVGAINVLEAMIMAPLTQMPNLGSVAPTPDPILNPNGAALRRIGAAVALRPDAYLGVAPLDAAKRYIQSVGHATHLDEIADAMVKGGAAVVGADWKEKLEQSLIRSTLEVVKVQDKTFGLVSFYSEEQLRGLRATRRQSEPWATRQARKKRVARKLKAKVRRGPAEEGAKKDEAAGE